ncbi:MAG: putative N-acetyl-LL-diaminopimelate aminotransferase [Burkholderiaceae bacterium]|nr:putative N-acetyl-LL-diaminopimelate aminotransferase [Burkholderiaceae bacterium]
MKIASRLDRIEPFYVMECAKAAHEIAASALCDPARGGRPMIYLNIGEPDFGAAPLVREAAQRAIRDGRTQYTQATGLPALRERIAQWYERRFGVRIAARRIVVTAGASAGLQLACAALFERGDEVLMPDPCYPCNRHFVAAADATAVLLPTTAHTRFQLDAGTVAAAWGTRTRGALLATPSNPTGTSIDPDELARIVGVTRAHGAACVVDEIYLGLSYDERFARTVLSVAAPDDAVVSVNSFSKYFGMTGWRLGWLVLPDALVEPVERLAQNLYICASTVAQHAALACFDDESIAEFERRRTEFERRRAFVVAALRKLRMPAPVTPDGAFYAYADCSAHSANSWDFCFDLMRRAQVALTPGRDFGRSAPERYLRLSYASSMTELEEAMDRLQHCL